MERRPDPLRIGRRLEIGEAMGVADGGTTARDGRCGRSALRFMGEECSDRLRGRRQRGNAF